MNKIVWMMLVLTLAAISCKKHQPETQHSRLDIASDFPVEVVEGAQQNVHLAMYSYKTAPNVTSFKIGITFADNKNGQLLGSLSSFRIIVVNMTTNAMATFSSSTAINGETSGMDVSGNTVYGIYVFANANQPLFGTTATQIWCRETIGENIYDVTGPVCTRVFGFAYAPTVRDVTPENSTAQNGEVVIVKQIEITAPSSHAIAFKQFASAGLYADNGSTNSLMYTNLLFERNGVDEIDQVIISDSLGSSISSLSGSVMTHKKWYVTYTSGRGEIIIPAGQTTTLTVKGTKSGFGPIQDGDAISMTSQTDMVAAAGSFVNKGVSGYHAKLYTSPSASSNARAYNFIWSPMNADTHSGQYGVSSGDWKNGYGIQYNTKTSIVFKMNNPFAEGKIFQ